MKYLFATLTLLFFSVTAQAGPLAGKLADSCKSKDPLEQGLCYGYFTGLADASSGMDVVMKDGSIFRVVYADNVTTTQLIHVFVKYVTDNPAVENKPAASVYVHCLVKAKLMGFEPVARKTTDQ